MDPREAPVTQRMFVRFWALVAAAYLVGAAGLVIALFVVARNAEDLQKQTDALHRGAHHLVVTAGALCMAVSADGEAAETKVLDDLADGHAIVLDTTCDDLVDQLRRGNQ